MVTKKFVIFISYYSVGQHFEQSTERLAQPYCMMPGTSARILKISRAGTARGWPNTSLCLSFCLSVCLYPYVLLHFLHLASLGCVKT